MDEWTLSLVHLPCPFNDVFLFSTIHYPYSQISCYILTQSWPGSPVWGSIRWLVEVQRPLDCNKWLEKPNHTVRRRSTTWEKKECLIRDQSPDQNTKTAHNYISVLYRRVLPADYLILYRNWKFLCYTPLSKTDIRLLPSFIKHKCRKKNMLLLLLSFNLIKLLLISV